MDETQMMEFVGQAVADVGALLGGAMVVIGDKLGLYRAMAGTGSVTPAELAARTGTAERYVREWLSAQAARGYVTYDGEGRFSLPDEHAVPLTDETSPACVIGAFEIALGSVYATDTIAERFRSGGGFAWGAHDEHVLHGCERFFRPGYLNNLASAWIPALDGVDGKLAAGARVADVGCGHGASTLLLADAYPASAVTGFDAHDGSVEAARKRAADAGAKRRNRTAERIPQTATPGRPRQVGLRNGQRAAACQDHHVCRFPGRPGQAARARRRLAAAGRRHAGDHHD